MKVTMETQLTVREAYEVAFHFLDAYYDRGGRSDKGLADLLSNMSKSQWAGDVSADPAQVQDWKSSAQTVLSDLRA
jgi:hypothetical protein